MKTPITYYPDWARSIGSNPDDWFRSLSDDLDWEHREDGKVPRMEYYSNDFNNPYMYGTGKGQREYLPMPYHPVMTEIRKALENLTGTVFEVCFLNRYLNQSHHLGWHADDSTEMDDEKPIGIVSLGVEREIWFRSKPLVDVWKIAKALGSEPSVSIVEPEKLKLGHGSLCLMNKGMQDTHQHRIPKASFTCGERISLTFRGYVK